MIALTLELTAERDAAVEDDSGDHQRNREQPILDCSLGGYNLSLPL